MYKQTIPDVSCLRTKKSRPIRKVIKEAKVPPSCLNCKRRPDLKHEKACKLVDITGKCIYWEAE